MESRGRGGGGHNNKKRDKKAFYKQAFQQTKKSEELQGGICGFLITCDQNKEKRCVKEIFNILNDEVEKQYPTLDIKGIVAADKASRKPVEQQKLETKNNEGDNNNISEQIDNQDDQQQQQTRQIRVEDEIRDEINSLRKERIFFVFETNTKGVIFVKLLDALRPYIDVNKLGVSIVEHIHKTQESKSRFACRFIPVDLLCKASKLEEFTQLATPILHKYFKQDPQEEVKDEQGIDEVKDDQNEPKESDVKSWCLEFKKRNNDSVNKKDYLDFFFKAINGRKHPVELKNPDYFVMVEVFKNLLMLAVVPKYKEYRKYNLQQLVKGESEDEGDRKVIKVSELNNKHQESGDKEGLADSKQENNKEVEKVKDDDYVSSEDEGIKLI